MPIYEYACAKCGKTIEAIQRFSDPPLHQHAGCGGALNKLLSLPSVRVKAAASPDGSADCSVYRESVERADQNSALAGEKKARKRANVVSLPSSRKANRKSRK